MTKKPRKQLVIDDLAATLRRPSARPLVDPAEAIAIGLSMVQPGSARLVSPDGAPVRMVQLALKLAGWKIEPR
jgi:hypothetical protein